MQPKLRRRRNEARLRKNAAPLYSSYCRAYSALSEKYRVYAQNPDKVFVKALAEISRALGKKTVAEFVENEAVLTLLKEFRIDFAQGYHLGKPELLEQKSVIDEE